MTRPAVTVDDGATLREAAHQLWAHAVGVVIVEREGRPVGVLSERDVVGALGCGSDPDAVLAREVMTPQMLTADPADRVLTAVLDMVDRGIRHLPVFDAAGRCEGVVSMRDLVRSLLVDALEVEHHEPQRQL
jgi:CBS domain-containing protein